MVEPESGEPVDVERAASVGGVGCAERVVERFAQFVDQPVADRFPDRDRGGRDARSDADPVQASDNQQTS